MTSTIFDIPFTHPDDKSNIQLLSVCYDLASSEKAGAKYAPKAILEESNYQEHFSTYQFKSLENIKISYLGTITQNIDINKMMNEIEYVADLISAPTKLVTLGGDHSITFPIIKSLYKDFPDLQVLQFDAHADLRPEYEGSIYSHASVMYSIGNLIGFENIKQFGIRSCTEDEFHLMTEYDSLLASMNKLNSFVNTSNKPLYITIDMDVFDNLTGTGTPVPGGITFSQFIEFIKMIPDNNNIVGFDIVETAPNLDPSGYSTIVATLVLKELLLKIK